MSKTISNSKKRKTRSDKFPLTLHPTGQYCKKIKGKLYYFGTDKREALQRYPEDAVFLHSGKGQKSNIINGNVSIKTICNLYIDHQNSRVQQKSQQFDIILIKYKVSVGLYGFLGNKEILLIALV